MSIIYDQLATASFPGDYADILIDVLGITPGNFLPVKNALHHFRTLDDDQVDELIGWILETFEPAG